MTNPSTLTVKVTYLTLLFYSPTYYKPTLLIQFVCRLSQLIFHVGSLDLNLFHTCLPYFRPPGEIHEHFLQSGVRTLDLTFFIVVGLSTKELVISGQCSCFIPSSKLKKTSDFLMFSGGIEMEYRVK